MKTRPSWKLTEAADGKSSCVLLDGVEICSVAVATDNSIKIEQKLLNMDLVENEAFREEVLTKIMMVTSFTRQRAEEILYKRSSEVSLRFKRKFKLTDIEILQAANLAITMGNIPMLAYLKKVPKR